MVVLVLTNLRVAALKISYFSKKKKRRKHRHTQSHLRSDTVLKQGVRLCDILIVTTAVESRDYFQTIGEGQNEDLQRVTVRHGGV